MNPLLVCILGSVAALFGALLCLFAYAQLKADPDTDGFMSLRSDIGTSIGQPWDEWAEKQNSKAFRVISLIFACAFTAGAVSVTVWGAMQTIQLGAN